MKNSFLKRAITAGLPELSGALTGQTAIVMGEKESRRGEGVEDFRGGIQEAARQDRRRRQGRLSTAEQIGALADCRPREVLLAQLLGVLLAPATSSSACSTNPPPRSPACSRPRRTRKAQPSGGRTPAEQQISRRRLEPRAASRQTQQMVPRRAGGCRPKIPEASGATIPKKHKMADTQNRGATQRHSPFWRSLTW